MDNLENIDQQHIWHPFTPLLSDDENIFIDSAEGIYLKTKDGRKIIDAISSWWVNLHGHANPYIAKAVGEQALKLEHVIFAGFTHEPAIRLTKNLLGILPENQSRIFFSDNGSTAVEVALKMAFQYWYNQDIQKKKVIAFKRAYHGDTFGSMSVGERGLFTEPFSPYLFDVDFIDLPDEQNKNRVIENFQTTIQSGEVAAFIFEPLIQGASGMRMYSAEVLDKLIHLAKQHSVVCIADEVFTGFGRTGKLFASDYLKNKPDIMALSKGLTGGTMPLGVTSCTNEIANPFFTSNLTKMFFHGHSFTANPLACAAANASLELLKRDECKQNIQRIEQQHLAFVSRIKNHPNVKVIRSCGTVLALEINHSEDSTYINPIRKKIYAYFISRNILLRPLGNVIYIVPPYIISSSELNEIYSCLEDFLELN